MVSILRLRGKPTGAVVAVGLLDLVDMTAKLLLRSRGRQAKQGRRPFSPSRINENIYIRQNVRGWYPRGFEVTGVLTFV